MNDFGKKVFINKGFSLAMICMISIGWSFFLFLFIVLSLNSENLRVFLIGVFTFILISLTCLAIILMACFMYYQVDVDGVTNGHLFFKKKILFSEMDFLEIKLSFGSTSYGVSVADTLYFYKNNRNVSIPLQYLKTEEVEWLKRQVKIKNIFDSL